MAPQIDTAQQVAELVSEIYNRVDGRGRLEGSALAEALDVARHALQQARRDALAEAVKVCREFSKGYDMEWWRETPKTEIYKTACLEMIAQLDRLREGVEG